jgi:hypothetical protein
MPDKYDPSSVSRHFVHCGAAIGILFGYLAHQISIRRPRRMILFSGQADQNEQGEKVGVGGLAWPLCPLEVSRFIGMGGF